MGTLLMVLLFVLVLTFVYGQASGISKEVKENDVKVLEDACNNAIITCYAVEGVYPKDIDYIVENYGVVYDKEKFFIIYENEIINARPRVEVVRLSEDE